MAANKGSLSFGRYLKNARLESGLSLQRISTHTRIGIDNLLAIERDDHARLPAEVFVRGFIRAYAAAVGADADEAINLYLANRRISHEKKRAEADLMKSGLNFWPRLLSWLSVLFAAMALSVMALSFFQEQNVSKLKEVKPGEMAPKVPPADAALSAGAKIPAAPVAPEKLLLKIVTVEKTWLEVVIDDQKPREYNLNPGDRLELEALAELNLLIGNAAGVQLNLNSRDLAVAGERGQVVALKLP